MYRTIAVLAFAALPAAPLRAQESQSYVEFGVHSNPPAITDFDIRKVWKAGGRFVRIDAIDGNGVKTTRILDDKKGEPHAYLLAGSTPQIPLEVGRELEFFKDHGAARLADLTRNGRDLSVQALDIDSFKLTLYVDLATGKPRELTVQSPGRNYSVIYAQYERAEPFNEAWFRSDERTALSAKSSAEPPRAEATPDAQMYIEYGRTTSPPSSTDYTVRQLWRAGRHLLRIQYPQDRSGNSTLKIANGRDLYTSTTRPPRIERTRTDDPDGEPHAYVLARGAPAPLNALEIGNEVEFFNEQHAAREQDTRIRGVRCAVYSLDVSPYRLTLYVDLAGGNPRELVVKSPNKEFAIHYSRYDRGRAFDPAWFSPPGQDELRRAPAMMGTKAPPPPASSAPDHPHVQVGVVPWNFEIANRVAKEMRPGDTLQYRDPDGTVAYIWRATKESIAALNAMYADDFERALPLMRAAAERGDARAQYNMAFLADKGYGSAEEAEQWLAKSSAQGFVFATYGLALALQKKVQGEAEPEKTQRRAIELYREAAEHGLREAKFALGTAYLDSRETTEDAALEWIKKAAADGHAEAVRFLNNFEKTKKRNEAGDKRNLANLRMLEKMAAQGDSRAETAIGNVYVQALGVPRNMKKAAEWYKKAADHGQADAMILLGMLHLDGYGIEKDEAAGLDYFNLALDKGFSPAAAVLSSLYHQGHGVGKDETRSREYFDRATKMSTPDELVGSGSMLLYGLNAPRDEETGVKLLAFSAKKGYIPAQFVLGEYYWSLPNGRDTRINNAKALEWHLKAASQEFDQSQLRVADLYLGTFGVRMDLTKAAYWLKQAAASGNDEAQSKLDSFKSRSAASLANFTKDLSNASRPTSGIPVARLNTINFCNRLLDVPVHSPEKKMSAAEMNEFFSIGPGSERNPKLAECLRRFKAAETQLEDLED